MRSILNTFLVCLICVLICASPRGYIVSADEMEYVENPELTCKSLVMIDNVFGDYTTTVDENIYYSMSTVNGDSLIDIYGNYDNPMFDMAKQCINPCMAFATTWGEAGSSYPSISLTTVMDFKPSTYVTDIDWISLSNNLEQVDSLWYITNTMANYNTNEDGNAYMMPNSLLQIPKEGSRQTSSMLGLGVGPYQITSSDWDTYDLDDRVNPIWGFEESLRKCGSAWITSGIEPISDITVYACLSLGHQGGSLIKYQFGKDLINLINTYEVQNVILKAGYNMFCDARELAYGRDVSLSDINVTPYIAYIESELGVDFSNYADPAFGVTNKGDYVIKHVLRYVFYKYYFTSGK